METQPIDFAALAAALTSSTTWIILAAMIGFGMLGGWAHRLGAPVEDKTSLLGYLVIGAVTALGALFVVTPRDGARLVGLAVVAGYAGKAVLSALQSRVEAALAKVEAVKATRVASEAIATGKEAIEHARKASAKTAQEVEQLGRSLALRKDLPIMEAFKDTEGLGRRFYSFLDEVPDVSTAALALEAGPDQLKLEELAGRLNGLAQGLSA